jgi:hypothetical protein
MGVSGRRGRPDRAVREYWVLVRRDAPRPNTHILATIAHAKKEAYP